MTSVVYFARASKTRLVKIGFTADLKVRMIALGGSVGGRHAVLHTVPGGRSEEGAFHKQFRELREHGEYFRHEGALRAFLRSELNKQKSASIGRHRQRELLNPGEIERIPMNIGYARVSTEDQSLDVQLDALRKHGCDHVFHEKVSAVNAKRPYWRLTMKFLELGDTLVVHAFSRINRDLVKLLGAIDELKARGVKVVSLSEPHIDPFTTNGRLLVSVTGAVDENERGRVRDRTKAAMRLKMAQGMSMGRPRVVTDTVAARIKRDFEHSSVPVLAKKYGVSKSSIYKCINA